MIPVVAFIAKQFAPLFIQKAFRIVIGLTVIILLFVGVLLIRGEKYPASIWVFGAASGLGFWLYYTSELNNEEVAITGRSEMDQYTVDGWCDK